jgi:hypothetical protein
MHIVTATRSRLAATLTLFGALVAGANAQTTVVINCDRDNTLYESATGALSNGAGTGFFVGINGFGQKLRGLLHFNVAAAVPAGAAIVAAHLTIDSRQSNYSPNLDVTVHRAAQAWGEGTSVAPSGGGGGGAATTGDATWLHTFWPGTFWTNAGGDFSSDKFTISTPQIGIATSPDGPESAADVQFWLDNPAQNFGWVLKSDESVFSPTARRFASRQATSGQRPTLTVTYLVDGQVGVWGTGCPTPNGNLTFAYGGPMIGGTTVALNHTNGPSNSVGVNYFALDLYQPGFQIQPSCPIYLPLTQSLIPGFIFVTDAAGAGSASWTVPTIYPGLYFVSQSAVLDNSPFGLALSNAGVAKIL